MALIQPGLDALELFSGQLERFEKPTFLKGSADPAAEILAFAKTLNLPRAEWERLQAMLGSLSAAAATLAGAVLEYCPEVLRAVDSTQQSTLSHLERLAKVPLHHLVASAISKEELMCELLRELLNPNRFDQGDAPLCTPSSIQFELMVDLPALYVGLLADLCGPEGRSTLPGGAILELESETATPVNTALSEFVLSHSLAELVEQLFSVHYVEVAPESALERLRTFDANQAPNRPAFVQLAAEGHTLDLTVERVREGRVYVRDARGTLRSFPEARFAEHLLKLQMPSQPA